MQKIIKYLALFIALLSNAYAQYWIEDNPNNQPCTKVYQFYNQGSKTTYFQSPLLNKYDVKFYFLDLEVNNTSTAVSGSVTIHAKTTATMDTFVVELLSNMTVDSVKINGFIKSFTHTDDHIYVSVGTALASNTLFTAQIYYQGTPPNPTGFFGGIFNRTSTTWGNQVTYTLSQPYNARVWFPCKQVLQDKADSCWIFITTNASNKAGSNGILTNVVTLSGGKKRYEWKSKYPIAYYLISLSVAGYVDYTIYAKPAALSGDSIMIQNYIYNNPLTLPFFKSEIDKTKDFLEKMSDLFGLYPFYQEKYGHCMAPFSGGMEHQTMTTQGFFEGFITAHELAHQWFGDNVTCATWNDIWINEGFASYSEYLMAEFLPSLMSMSAAAFMDTIHNRVMKIPDGSVYVPLSESFNVFRIFDNRLTYRKGAAIIHNLRFEMQKDSLFFKTLKDFQTLFKDSVATGLDFKQVAENVCGKNFTDFFNQWYFGEGYPTYNINYVKTHSDTLKIIVTQTTSAPSKTPLFKGLVEYKLITTTGDTIVKLYQTANTNIFKIKTYRTVTNIIVDPNNWIINRVGSVISINDNGSTISMAQIYPNPVHDYLNISFENKGRKEILISDVVGKVVYHNHTDEDFISIPVEGLSNQIYLLTINTRDAKQTLKLAKQ
ncbi:MAG: M1 family aminopeptidase [Bacteroidia bacterium]|nr:M1 family aminopeptidase [Bacteroidia bacterium]MDW8347384.1 M1 family aminopeptidase [Bacteroidia bacterium]